MEDCEHEWEIIHYNEEKLIVRCEMCRITRTAYFENE